MTNKKRVQALEKRKRITEKVYAVWYEDSPMVQVCGSDEQLTLEEFELKYPDGELIHVIYERKPIPKTD